MKSETRPLVFAALAMGVCFAAGWWGARVFGETGRAAMSANVVGGPMREQDVSRAPVAETRKFSEALVLFSEGQNPSADEHAMAAVLLRMEAADFPESVEGMLQYFSNIKEDNSRCSALAEAWMARWLELDAPAALRFLETSPFLAKLPVLELQGWPLGERCHSSYGGIFTALARHQPAWLRKYLGALPGGEVREVGMYAMFRELAYGDLTQARQALAEFPKGKDRTAAATGLVAELAKRDAQAALEVAKLESEGWMRNEQLRLVFGQAGSRDFAGARALLEQIENPEERGNCALLAMQAATHEPPENLLPFIKEEAARMAEKLGGKVDFSKWAGYLRTMGQGTQARAFTEWALDFGPDKEGHLFMQLAQSWGAQSPKEFAAWVNERAGQFDAGQMARLGAAMASLSYNPPATRALAELMPTGPLRDQARFQVAVDAGKKGDIAPAAEAYRAIAAVDVKGALAAQLASAMAAKNGAAAADWAMQQPPGKARSEALRVVAEEWSQHDVHGAAQWLEAMPAGTERDQAIKTYATTVVVADADAAAQWVTQVADPLQRQQAAQGVFERWCIQDPVAARAWLQDLPGISEEMRGNNLRHGK